jgi:uncharacterized membrane protein
MKAFKNFVKTTVSGGILFLVPAVLVLLVLKHALQLARPVAKSITDELAVTQVGGIAVVTLVGALLLLLVAFAAGLMARTRVGHRLTGWFEESILGGMPQYRMVKSMAEGLTQIESGQGMEPVLVRSDEGWQLGYRLEALPGGWVAVFIPAAPTPMSGDVIYVPEDRVRPLSIGMPVAVKLVRRLGLGSAEALRGVDLGPSRGP